MSDEIERQMGDQMASLFNQREDELANLRAELAQARAERDALRADAERLEWLDAHPREGSIRIGGDIKSVVFWGVSAAPGMGLRSAIDGARVKEPK